MYKYFYNTRGRAIRGDEQKADKFRQKGFVEITQKQFENKKYNPKYDKGPNYHPPTTVSPVRGTKNKSASKRKILKTKRV